MAWKRIKFCRTLFSNKSSRVVQITKLVRLENHVAKKSQVTYECRHIIYRVFINLDLKNLPKSFPYRCDNPALNKKDSISIFLYTFHYSKMTFQNVFSQQKRHIETQANKKYYVRTEKQLVQTIIDVKIEDSRQRVCSMRTLLSRCLS